jgi:hypothetical protein
VQLSILQAGDVRLQPALVAVCSEEMNLFCGDVEPGGCLLLPQRWLCVCVWHMCVCVWVCLCCRWGKVTACVSVSGHTRVYSTRRLGDSSGAAPQHGACAGAGRAPWWPSRSLASMNGSTHLRWWPVPLQARGACSSA